jgi:hypothetical protein
MKQNLFSRISRFFAAIVAAAIMAASLPHATLAATVPIFSFTTIKAGETVTVHGENFPKDTNFNVRMDVFGDLAVDGINVGVVNSGTGTFDATFAIPSSLKNERTIAMRMDAASGWYSYNWFTNQSVTSPTPTQPSPVGGGKPFIDIVAVDKNNAVTVQTGRFPANQNFTIRVGPFNDFFKKYVVTGSVNSGSGGTFKFTVQLPAAVKDVETITIRLDSNSGAYAFNAFKNVSSGTVVVNPTPTPAPSLKCEVSAATVPSRTLKLREDFDAVWTVKNNTGKTWDLSSVDYKLVSGTEMQKYGKSFDLKATVKSGESIKIVVDMLAPNKAGTYTTTWAIVEGTTTLCSLPITVVVK